LLKILIIEDNEQNLYMFKFLLEKNGFQVVTSANGGGGIKAANEEKPDLIVLDIQLPDISGYEVAKKLKANTKTAHIPIIAITSYAYPDDRKKAQEAGCNGYIPKPIDPNAFIDEIRRFIK